MFLYQAMSTPSSPAYLNCQSNDIPALKNLASSASQALAFAGFLPAQHVLPQLMTLESLTTFMVPQTAAYSSAFIYTFQTTHITDFQ